MMMMRSTSTQNREREKVFGAMTYSKASKRERRSYSKASNTENEVLKIQQERKSRCNRRYLLYINLAGLTCSGGGARARTKQSKGWVRLAGEVVEEARGGTEVKELGGRGGRWACILVWT